jgi:hypothetical protein
MLAELALIATLAVKSQAAPPASAAAKFEWDIVAPDLATAQGYTYFRYDDGALNGVAFANVTCAASAAGFTCDTPVPAYTPGAHTIQVSASDAGIEGPKSASFAFRFVVVPAAPTSVRIK